MFAELKQKIAQEIVAALPDLTICKIPVADLQLKISQLIEIPRGEGHGQLAVPLFQLAPLFSSNPKTLAEQWSQVLQKNTGFIRQAEALAGFLNLTLDAAMLQDFLFVESGKLEKSKVVSSIGSGKKVVIDLVSPNVAKPMHIGHFRTAVIGQAIVYLAQAVGYETISVNHLGDWGTQFGKLALAIQTWPQDVDLNNLNIDSLLKIYVKFHDEAKKDPQLDLGAAQTFIRLEKGDPGITAIWKKIVEVSMREYQRLFDILKIKHDAVIGESFYNSRIPIVVQKLRDQNLLQESDGAQVVFFPEKEKIPPCLIAKADGGSIYASRDLAAAVYRHDEQKGDMLLYVVGQEQALHFKQVFRVLEMMGYDWAKQCHHIGFGLYRFPEGKMSTREGKVILFEDILTQAHQKVLEIIEQKNPDLENKNQAALDIGIGALIFNDLLTDRVKNVDFNWETVCDFNGDSGPFVQYSYVRCLGVLKKLSNYKKPAALSSVLNSQEAQQLILKLILFDEAVLQSWKQLRPNVLAQYLLQLAKAFGRFYHENRIVGSSNETDLAWLVSVTAVVLKRGLEILNIPAPEAM